MDTSRGTFAWLFSFLFLTALPGFAQGSELSTRYTWDNVTYPSLQAAEQALWNDDFVGSAYYRYQYSDNYGILRRYDHPPSTGYFEAPKLAFWSVPAVSCDDSPLYDQFGNDHCSGVTPGRCCGSEENWWAAAQNQWPDTDCPLIKTGEGPWVKNSINAVSYPMKLPEEYLMLQGRYSKFIDAEYPPGESSGCGRNYDFTMTAISPGYCPGGYTRFGNLGGIDQCYVTLNATITALGARPAEPGPNSCAVGNPCHPATGDKTLSETDFDSPTLPFSRHYHSQQLYPDYAAMGKGWSHTYSGRIVEEDGLIKMIDGKGNAERFTCADSPGCSNYASGAEPGHVLRPVAGGWDVYLKSGEVRQYDSSGRLVLMTDRSGTFREVAVTYNSKGLVSLVIDQSGRALQFFYNAIGLVDSITLPDGRQIRYDYAAPAADSTNNPKFNLVRVIREDSSERQYHYEDRDDQGADRYGHLLTGITDENGVRFATYTYDDQARVTSSEHAGGAGRIDLNYTRRPGESYSWSITQVIMPLGEVVTYDMEPGPFRKPTEIADSRGTVKITYDPSSTWRSSRTDREGHKTAFVYDALHETSRTEAVDTADERTVETDWDDAINRVSEIREPGRTTTYTHNARGQIVTHSITDTATLATRTWTYHYFEPPSLAPLIGQLKSIDGPRADVSDVTTFEYYTTDHAAGDHVVGDLKAEVNALGHRSDYLKYDGSGRPLQIRDANNVLTTLTYHPRGWLSTQTTDGKTTSFGYDGVGNLTRVTQADGSYINYQYDAAHRLVAISDNLDNRVEYTLDDAGNRTAEMNHDQRGVLRRQLGRVYDTLNRLVVFEDGTGDQIQYAYDNNGNRVSLLDENLNTTRFEYDPLDRLVKSIDSLLGETLMEYDDRDKLVSVSDPLGNITRYDHDGLDNQLLLDSPDTGFTDYEYDQAGNRIAVTDARNIRVEYGYDALNRPGSIVFPDSSLNVSFQYDDGINGKGRLTGMVDSAGSVDYGYDERGNLLNTVRVIDSNQYISSFTYNDANRVAGITYPSGLVIGYNLDAAGRITGMYTGTETLVSNVSYEPFGPITSFTFGNGLAYSAAFNQDYELESLQSGPALDWRLGYDPVGNVVTITDQADDRFSQAFTYDELYRLETASGSYRDESFEYDPNGNRIRHLDGLSDDVYAYESGSNRLAAQNGWSFSRDEAGNRTEKLDVSGDGQLFSYADHNRLIRTSTRDAVGETVAGEYVYDGRGQRVRKTASGNVTHYVYGQSGELLGEYADDGSPLKEYIYLDGHLVAVRDTETEIPPSAPVEIILDNDTPGTSSTGKWRNKTNRNDYGDDYRLGEKTDTYRWTPPPLTGTFEVYAWWVSGKKNSEEATYTINHGGVHEVMVLGHEKNGGRWNLLGTFDFDGSGNEYVELHSGNGKKISADAIHFKEIPGGDGSTTTATSTYFIHTDHLGTPRRVSDDFQSIVWRWDSRPFGDSFPDEDPDGDSRSFNLNLGFPGQYFDIESGLHYNYLRTYDPTAGRYVESDPIGLRGALNTFAYVENDPLNAIDPSGLIKLYGSWCGPNWTGGFKKPYDKLDTAERSAALPPIDVLDQCCRNHDITYSDCRIEYPCDAKSRQRCFQQADRLLSRCASQAGGGQSPQILMFGNPRKRIADYMRDSIPGAEDNAEHCECE